MSDRNVSEEEIIEALSAEDVSDELRNLVNRLAEQRDELESELDEVKVSRDALESDVIELESKDREPFNVLRAVRDWFDDVILLGRPMSDPRAMWKKVERALES